MKVVDLSHLMCSNMPVYSQAGSPSFQITHILERDGFRETKYIIYSHTGTHIDAPAHMINSGPNLDNLDINHFFGKATMLDFCHHKYLYISIQDLFPYQEKISKVDFVILKTGWSQHWGKNQYYTSYPHLNEKSAEWLTRFNLKGIGVDAISIDQSESIDFAVHKILLSQKTIIIENLTNLDAIENEYFLFCVFPLKIKNADGSPVRAVALENSCK
ncbi:MAG: cyclase family protein [Atribacterota bacterium]|jgi:kynurenine formamidase|nr:cyclase family protein [Atribacterota bacterium]MDD4896647.1 cyclase family protein [Atribacterota bacterium]MDD5637121.1 cyclase family protein [Atribacterota bacterium]